MDSKTRNSITEHLRTAAGHLTDAMSAVDEGNTNMLMERILDVEEETWAVQKTIVKASSE